MSQIEDATNATRLQGFQRLALLYFLPLVILNLIAGARIMSRNPGLVEGEHVMGYVLAGVLALAGLALIRNPRLVQQVSYILCLTLIVFFGYREASLLYGPAIANEKQSLFFPLFGYHAIIYFAFLVFLPRSIAEKVCWAMWLYVTVLVMVRFSADWPHFLARQGGRDLLIYLLVANPMFIFLGRLMLQMQEQVSEAEAALQSSRRELQLLEDVAESEARFERAVRGSRDGLWEWPDTAREAFWVSERGKSLLGLQDRDVPPSFPYLLRHTHPDDQERVREAFSESQRDNHGFELEARFGDGDPEQFRWFALKGFAETDPETGIQCMAGSLQSIEARKRAEAQMQADNEALTNFAGIAAHDIKAPLRKIQSFSSLIGRKLEQDPATARQHLERIKVTTDRLLELLESLLTYASSSRQVPMDVVNLRLVMKDVLEALSLDIDAKNAQIDVGEMPRAWSNATSLRQVFQNLIANSLKFCERQPQIRITANVCGPWVQIRLTDNGIGIPADHLANIRKPLERLHTQSEYEGHGLGLATVERTLNRLQGRLEISSEEGVGSSFCIYLPVPREADQNPAADEM